MSESEQPISQTSDFTQEPELLCYHRPGERFRDMCRFIRALCFRYLRYYRVRLLTDHNVFSPNDINTKEILYHSDIEIDEKQTLEWLNSHHIPTPEEIIIQLQALQKYIESRIEATYTLNHPEYLPLETIQAQFQLTSGELLLLCAIAAAQLDDNINRFYRYLTGLESTIFPGNFYVRLLSNAQLSDFDILQMLSPDKPLRTFSLIEVGIDPHWGNDTPVLHAPLRIPNRIASFLVGIEENPKLDCAIIHPPVNREVELILPANFKKFAAKSLRCIKPRVGFYGPRGYGRKSWIYEYASKQNQNVLEVSPAEIPSESSVEDILTLVGLWFREARLQQAILLFSLDREPESEILSKLRKIAPKLNTIIHNHPGTICLTASQPSPWIREIFGEHTEITCPSPLRQDQPRFWSKILKKYLSANVESIVDYISSSYILTPGEMDGIIQSCIARVGINRLDGPNLLETLRTSRGHELAGLAELKSTPLGLRDIVLNPEAFATIQEILDFSKYSEIVRNEWGFSRVSSGGGLSVLFSGPPGTGKTLTAGVLAHELQRALYVVDISRVVDKYIGETEKRLAKIFEHAQASQAILLFDEADSLFAKRTSVKSSNDRYANLEVNYLLQKLESYNGISILTTNLADSLDEALARRIQFKITFPMPNAEERAKLWRFLTPEAVRTDSINYDRLGECFEMSGGHIKNAVFRACIQAASRRAQVTTEMLYQAAVHEYREMGHVIRET